jgi:hypothetical protein
MEKIRIRKNKDMFTRKRTKRYKKRDKDVEGEKENKKKRGI